MRFMLLFGASAATATAALADALLGWVGLVAVGNGALVLVALVCRSRVGSRVFAPQQARAAGKERLPGRFRAYENALKLVVRGTSDPRVMERKLVPELARVAEIQAAARTGTRAVATAEEVDSLLRQLVEEAPVRPPSPSRRSARRRAETALAQLDSVVGRLERAERTERL